MRRRSFILVVALALVAMLGIGVMYAVAASSTGGPTMKVIIVYKSQGGPQKVVRALAARDARSVYTYHLIPAVAATVTQSTVEALRRDPGVVGVFADRKVAPPHDPLGSEGTARAGKASAAAAAPI